MLEFDQSTACRMKCLAIKKNNEVKSANRFFSGKMLYQEFHLCVLSFKLALHKPVSVDVIYKFFKTEVEKKCFGKYSYLVPTIHLSSFFARMLFLLLKIL